MMRIVAEKTQYHRFAFYYDYNPQVVEFCRSIKDAFGWQHFAFQQDGDKKRWVFSQIPILETLVSMYTTADVDPQVRLIINNESASLREAEQRAKIVDEIKDKKDTSFRVKGLKGEPYQYQNVGIEFIDASDGRTIVADAPGVGKTLQALGYAVHKKFSRTLVVCPATVKPAWESEVHKWTKLTPYVFSSKTTEKDVPEDASVWIVNYDILKKHLALLTKVRFDYLVGDEAHLLKSPIAQRTKAFRRISQHIPHVVLLSGTPLLSRPVELFSLLNIIDPKSWANYYEYVRQYCNAKQTRFGLDVSGVSNPEELHTRIRRYFIRRRKDDVLGQLPQKNHIKLPVELSREYRALYNSAEDDIASFLRENKGKRNPEIAKIMQAEKLAKLGILRALLAESKVDAAIELIDSIIESGEKVLVFGSYIAPLKKIKDHYNGESVIITGESSDEERKSAVDRFQADPTVKVFVGGYKSAGVGITLTAAQNVIFSDYSWTPADHQQAEDRAHRPGATGTALNIYQLHANGTIDHKMHSILERKQAVFDQVIDGSEVVDDVDNAVAEVIDDITTRRMLLGS